MVDVNGCVNNAFSMCIFHIHQMEKITPEIAATCASEKSAPKFSLERIWNAFGTKMERERSVRLFLSSTVHSVY